MIDCVKKHSYKRIPDFIDIGFTMKTTKINTPKIVVVGSLHIDLAVKTKKIPKVGETVQGGNLKISPGGKGANQAVAAARLGADVVLIGRVGNDEFGRKLIEKITDDGISKKYIIKDKTAPTGVALIMIDEKGNNSIAVAPGADLRCSIEDVNRAKDIIKSSQILLAQLEIPPHVVEHAIKLAHKYGVKVILNLAPFKKISNETLKKVHVLTLNETEAELLSSVKVRDAKSAKEAAKKILGKGPVSVIITLGEKGAVLSTKEKVLYIKGIKVKSVDTTGAGDTFCGALAVALASGKDLVEAVKYANCAGALSVTKRGAQEAMPRSKELENFIRLHANERNGISEK